MATSDRHALAWDIDLLAEDDVHRRFEALSSFATWLQECDIPVPACWYTHGWVVRRLAALASWQEAAYAPGAHPREAADWWLVGVEALRHDWAELLAHRGKHVPSDSPLDHPQPVPSLDETIESILRERRR
jgi:hypothetical protein